MTKNGPDAMKTQGRRVYSGRPSGTRGVGVRRSRRRIRALDLFAGVGGSSHGARTAGVRVVAAVDSWDLARKAYKDNFPDVRFYRRKCEKMFPGEIRRDVGRINLLIASPECTSHSCARGNGKRYESSRKTAMQVVRFARALRPRWIVVENVVQMRRWRRYQEWLGALKGLGYKTSEVVLDSADFGVPQSRKRLFVLCDRRVEPPREVAPARGRKKRTAGDVVDKHGTYRSSPLWTGRRAEATLTRARRAIAKLGGGRPFLLVYYGSDGAGGWQRLNIPLRTVTTLDRFAYVRRNGSRVYEMRMLQVPELKQAMGFPKDFKLLHGARRDRIHLLGNAVCPPVLRAVVSALMRSGRRQQARRPARR